MPSVYTIEGADLGRAGGKCKRVRSSKRGCSITTCKGRDGKWKFKKGTYRCGGR